MCNSQRQCLREAGANLGFENQVFQPQGWDTWFLKHSPETVNSLNSKSDANIGAVFLQDVQCPIGGSCPNLYPSQGFNSSPQSVGVGRGEEDYGHGAGTGGQNDGNGEV